MDLWTAVIGFLVGIFIGTSGMGGGLIVTPLLIFGLGVSPAVAVGSDLIFAAMTKMFGAWQHWRQKTIDFSLLKCIAMGSIPGSIVGTILLWQIQKDDGILLDHFITQALAATFLVTSLVMILQWITVSKRKQQNRNIPGTLIVMIGFFIGIVVTITSVGSGTLFMALLLMIYPYQSSKLVGTDILHGVLLTGMAGVAHAFLGTTDLALTVNLLAGSIPGVLIGSKLVLKLPDSLIRSVLIIMLILTSITIFLK